jgi:hypothetical protein
MEQCSICCLDFTPVVRHKIECPGGCDLTACLACVKTYLLERPLQPCCMNCRIAWTPEFIDETFTRGFRRGVLAERTRKALLDLEKAKLPDTVEEANMVRRRKELYDRYSCVSREIGDAEDAQFHEHDEGIARKLDELYRARNDILRQFGEIREAERGPRGVRKEFVKGCPSESCRGFLTSQWNCQLCGCKACKDCHAIVREGSQHACDPDDVATARLISQDSKTCPKCAALISKVDGCDQMWCPSCKTAFSWRTLVVETGPIHNPEYFRWMRDNGYAVPRNPGDQACGFHEDVPWLHEFANAVAQLGVNWEHTVPHVIRCLNHVKYVLMWRLTNDITVDPDKDLRIRYLLNDIDENQWKASLYKRERTREKRKAKIQTYDMLVKAGGDVLRKCLHNLTGQEDIDAMVVELEALRDYFNDTCLRVNARFGHALMRTLSEDWHLD